MFRIPDVLLDDYQPSAVLREGLILLSKRNNHQARLMTG
jgi:hypothetical protein